MRSIDAVKSAALSAGIPTTHIGPAIGKSDSYVSANASRGSDPAAGNVARMLSVCGYVLAAVPSKDVPPSAIVIDPAE